MLRLIAWIVSRSVAIVSTERLYFYQNSLEPALMGHTEQENLETPFTQLLGLSTPIVQGPMGELDLPELVAAVSNAGGLGILGLSWTSQAEIKSQIEQTRSLTSRPFGINLILDWDQRERLALALEAGVKVVFFSWGNPEPYLPLVREHNALSMSTVGSAAEAAAAVEAGVDVIVAQGVEREATCWVRLERWRWFRRWLMRPRRRR